MSTFYLILLGVIVFLIIVAIAARLIHRWDNRESTVEVTPERLEASRQVYEAEKLDEFLAKAQAKKDRPAP